MKFKSNSHEETIKFGQILAKFLKENDTIGLYGDLGAGKTALVSGIVKGLGFDDYISSPTFTIVNEYNTKIPVFHFDVYRVSDADELYAIGFDEYFYRDGIVIIEWAEYIEEIMPKEYLKIVIKTSSLNVLGREIELIAKGEKYQKLLQDISDRFGGIYESISS